MNRTLALLMILLGACSPAENRSPDVEVTDAWARATTAEQTVATAYLTIANKGGAHDTLVAVTSSTGPAQAHSTSMDGGIVRMRKLDRLAIPAGSTVKLEPGGTHVMLTGLARPLVAGSRIDLTLRFEKSGERKVAAAVRDWSGGRR